MLPELNDASLSVFARRLGRTARSSILAASPLLAVFRGRMAGGASGIRTTRLANGQLQITAPECIFESVRDQ